LVTSGTSAGAARRVGGGRSPERRRRLCSEVDRAGSQSAGTRHRGFGVRVDRGSCEEGLSDLQSARRDAHHAVGQAFVSRAARVATLLLVAGCGPGRPEPRESTTPPAATHATTPLVAQTARAAPVAA